jgi:phosphate transport system substrate-binding protein
VTKGLKQLFAIATPLAIIGLLLLASIAAVGSGKQPQQQQAFAQSQAVTLNGAGATFPFPLIDTWRVQYANENPNVNLNYQSIGSGGGIKQFTAMTVDFGASDAPLSGTQRSALKAPAVHIPETIGSVVVAYNIPEVPDKGVKLTGPILADIYLGKIKKWDDPQIKQINPDLPLPSKDITIVHRSDGSGTSFVFTSYLSLVSKDWSDQVGKGTAVQWPAGIAAPGNEGVANSVKNTPYSIGYVELAYALTTKMPYAFLQNKDANNFVEPTLETTRNAVQNMSSTLPKGDESWESVSLLNAPGTQSYPIASFSYLLLYKDLSTNPSISEEKAKELVKFVSWAIAKGQSYASDLGYVPLPQTVVDHNMETLRGLTYGQTSLADSVG